MLNKGWTNAWTCPWTCVKGCILARGDFALAKYNGLTLDIIYRVYHVVKGIRKERSSSLIPLITLHASGWVNARRAEGRALFILFGDDLTK